MSTIDFPIFVEEFCVLLRFFRNQTWEGSWTKLKLETGLFLKDSRTHESLSAAAFLLPFHILLLWRWPSLVSGVTGLHGLGHHVLLQKKGKITPSRFYTIHFDPFCIVDICSLIWFFLMQHRSPSRQGSRGICIPLLWRRILMRWLGKHPSPQFA